MYLTHTLDGQQVIFIFVADYSQRQQAAQLGFTWNQPQPGAWATTNIMVACEPVKQSLPVSVDLATLDYIKANTAMTDATYDRLKAAYQAPNHKQKAAINSATMTDEQIRCVHQALQHLAAVCDGARTDDGAGFNRNDLEYGHKLAAEFELSRSQAGYGKNLLKKYSSQLGSELYDAIFPELVGTGKAKKVKHKTGQVVDAEIVTHRPIELPASSIADPVPTGAAASRTPVGVTEPDGTVTVTWPESIVMVTGLDDEDDAAEIARLAGLLVTCHPGDFDTTVDMLRDLRKIDAPKEAGSDFTKAAWTAAGYDTK